MVAEETTTIGKDATLVVNLSYDEITVHFGSSDAHKGIASREEGSSDGVDVKVPYYTTFVINSQNGYVDVKDALKQFVKVFPQSYDTGEQYLFRNWTLNSTALATDTPITIDTPNAQYLCNFDLVEYPVSFVNVYGTTEVPRGTIEVKKGGETVDDLTLP